MKINSFNLFLISNIVVYLIVSAFFLQKSMFVGGADGFYSQMLFIANGGGFSSSPLYYVHVIRFIAVYPFYFIHTNEYGSFYESVIMLFFLLPIITAKFRSKQVFLQALFVYLPLFFSFRSVLVMCSMSYLFICLYGDKRSDIKLFLSALLANLSSGVLLPWILIVMLSVKRLSVTYRYVWFVVFVLGVIIAFSVMHKIIFFFGGAGESIMGRNTFTVSLLNEQYARLVLYVLISIGWVVITFVKIACPPFSNRLYMFYFPMVITMFFEGLGLISFLIPLLWFFLGVRPTNSGVSVIQPAVTVKTKERFIS